MYPGRWADRRRPRAPRPGFSVGALLLGLASTLVTVLALEGALRLTMDPSDLVTRTVTDPERHQRHNELRFWQRYRTEGGAFSSHDPLLGWDNRYGGTRVRDRARIDDASAVRARGDLRAVAVGDSFVYGNDVAAGENFSAVLERHWRLEVLNMGVPGYGIDQSFLKYREFGTAFEPDIVLFGVYVHDYERTTVAFTAFAKPRFVAERDGFLLTNQPVPHPTAELERIDGLYAGRWYLPALVEDLWHRVRPPADTAFFDRADAVIRHILRELLQTLAPNQRLLIVHIPSGEAFLEPEPVHREMHRRMLALYHELGIGHIDLLDAFGDVADPAARYYVTRPGRSPGHLSPAGHQRAAALIGARLGLEGR